MQGFFFHTQIYYYHSVEPPLERNIIIQKGPFDVLIRLWHFTWNISVLLSWQYSTTTVWFRDRVKEMLCCPLL